MAIVRTPFISFGASGKLAKTLVAFSWKGLDVMREYVVPTNPDTPAQKTQRTLFTGMVYAWRNFFTDSAMRAAWDVLSTILPQAMSGFNAAMRNMIKMAATDPKASFAKDATAAAGQTCDWNMLNVDDGVTGDEVGDFEIWYGSRAAALLKLEEVAIATGVLSSSSLGDTDDIVYVKLRKDGFDRSGVSKITLTA